MATTRVFQSGSSQVLHIPPEMRTDKDELYIHKIGDVYIAYPTDDPWASARQVFGSFPSCFMEKRNQPNWGEESAREAL